MEYIWRKYLDFTKTAHMKSLEKLCRHSLTITFKLIPFKKVKEIKYGKSS